MCSASPPVGCFSASNNNDNVLCYKGIYNTIQDNQNSTGFHKGERTLYFVTEYEKSILVQAWDITEYNTQGWARVTCKRLISYSAITWLSQIKTMNNCIVLTSLTVAREEFMWPLYFFIEFNVTADANSFCHDYRVLWLCCMCDRKGIQR